MLHRIPVKVKAQGNVRARHRRNGALSECSHPHALDAGQALGSKALVQGLDLDLVFLRSGLLSVDTKMLELE